MNTAIWPVAPALLLLAACGVPTQLLSASSEVVVAVAGPMTGTDAIFGEQMRRGAEMAVADINAGGGLLGRRLRLEVADDQCDRARALPVANELVRKSVVFVAGHYCSGVSIPASAVYAENNVLQITPASTNPHLTDEAKSKGWKTVFRTIGRDDIQGSIAGKYLVGPLKAKKIAILYDTTPYAGAIAAEVKRTINGLGVQEAVYKTFQKGERDYTALIDQMKEAGIEVVYVASYHTETALLMKQARERGLAARFVSEDALITPAFWQVSGPAGEGLLFTFASDPMQHPEAFTVVGQFLKAGFKPTGYTLHAYAAFQVFAAAVRSAGSLDAQQVAEQIHNRTFDTVLGRLQYDDKGDVSNAAYSWYQWRDSHYYIVEQPF